MKKFQRVRIEFTALMATVALMSSPPRAEAQIAAGAEDAGNSQLEEVTVTANRRPERLQDVPVSVTALTSTVLERSNVRELGDLVKLAPGLVIGYGSQPGNFSISMRGIGTFSNGIAVESDVAVVIDDVPVGFQAEAFTDLIDVERVEVLRGPQSTLFGKSAIAGVLNIVTSAPSHELEGKVTALATDDNEDRLAFTVSGPLSDTVRARLTVADSYYKGNILNLTTDKRINGSSGLTATAKVEWTPTDNLTFSLAPRFNRNQSTCCVSPITSLTPGLYYQGEHQFPASSVLAGIPIGPNNRYIRMDTRPGGGDSKLYGGTARMDYHFADTSLLRGHTFSSITSNDHWVMYDYQDQDGTDVPFLLYFPLTAPSGIDSGAAQDGYFRANSVTQELRLTSPDDTRLRYVGGLWYAKNDLSRFLEKGPVLNFSRYLAVSSNTNYSVYAQATFDLTEKLGLIGGVRENRQKIDYTFTNYIADLHFGQANQEDATTGKAGVQYKWTPDIMTFATYSTGYKGQAYDLVSTFNAKEAAQMPVPHETAKNYEVGLKSSLFDRRVYFNVTLFDADYYGFQTSVTSTLPDGTFLTYLNSVGHLKTRGLEIDGAARVTSNFTLNGSFAYTKATVAEFPNGPCYTNQTLAQGCYVDATNSKVQNLKGKPLNNVPKFKVNLGGEYDHALPGMPFEGFVGLTYLWQDDVNFSLSQDPRTVQKAYGIADFSLGAHDDKDRLRVTAFVNNAFDKRYAVGLADTTSGFKGIASAVGSTWTPPRDAFRYFGARVDVKF
jgi:iron complex outermembrane receptor protein